MKKRIAVISADGDLAEFFACEARACGCSAQVFSEPPEVLTEFDLVVLDPRAGLCCPDHADCRLAVVAMEGAPHGCSMADTVWQWPVPILDVRQWYERGTEGVSVSRERSTDAQTVAAIDLLSEEEHAVLFRNRRILLTEREWRLLCVLGERDGALVDRETLARALGSSDGNALKVHLCHLRRKLEAPFGVRLVETVRGKGYRLKLPLRRWN